jgi:hypothetical protein
MVSAETRSLGQSMRGTDYVSQPQCWRSPPAEMTGGSSLMSVVMPHLGHVMILNFVGFVGLAGLAADNRARTRRAAGWRGRAAGMYELGDALGVERDKSLQSDGHGNPGTRGSRHS